MDKINKNTFPEVMPNHPHRGLYILITVLVFVIVSGIIVLNQIKKANQNNNIESTSSVSKEQKIKEFNNKLIEISKDMKEANSGQNTLTKTQLENIANDFNKSKAK